jgi:ParB-like nuclease domain
MTTTALPPTPGIQQQVPLASILTDEPCQTRVKIRPAVVRAYAQAMTQQLSDGGLRFPAIVLFTDTHHYWLGDGFHRVLAARHAGLSDFPADVHPGTQRDALLWSISSNADHGLPRTNADKRKAVLLLLADAEWSQWSDGEIGRRCHVSQAFVSKLRRGASQNGFEIEPRKVKRGDTVSELRARKQRGPRATPDHPSQAAETAPPAAPATDRLGIPLRSEAAPAFASVSLFEAAVKLHNQLAELVDQLAKSPGGASYGQHLVRRLQDGKLIFYAPELAVFAQKLRSAVPHCGYCPRCQARHAGQVHTACQLCGGRGWLNRGEFEACPQHERQELERLLPKQNALELAG